MNRRRTRLDSALVAAAREIGGRSGRSAADQLNHWARLGMEFERSSTVTHERIDALLADARAHTNPREHPHGRASHRWPRRP